MKTFINWILHIHNNYVESVCDHFGTMAEWSMEMQREEAIANHDPSYQDFYDKELKTFNKASRHFRRREFYLTCFDKALTLIGLTHEYRYQWRTDNNIW